MTSFSHLSRAALLGCALTLLTAQTLPAAEVGSASVPALTQEQLKDLQARAEKGDAEACFQLSGAYHVGDGVPKDDTLAFTWADKAAK